MLYLNSLSCLFRTRLIYSCGGNWWSPALTQSSWLDWAHCIVSCTSIYDRQIVFYTCTKNALRPIHRVHVQKVICIFKSKTAYPLTYPQSVSLRTSRAIVLNDVRVLLEAFVYAPHTASAESWCTGSSHKAPVSISFRVGAEINFIGSRFVWMCVCALISFLSCISFCPLDHLN